MSCLPVQLPNSLQTPNLCSKSLSKTTQTKTQTYPGIKGVGPKILWAISQ
jgi:hypothetical protein